MADRIELAIGILSSLTANVHRDSKRRPEAFVPRDFMVDWAARLEQKEPEKSEGMSPEEILAAFDGLILIQESRGKVITRPRN